MNRSDDILAAAQVIRGELDRLLGQDAEPVGRQLEELIALAEQDPDLAGSILLLLAGYEATRERLRELLPGDAERGPQAPPYPPPPPSYGAPPGDPGEPPAELYPPDAPEAPRWEREGDTGGSAGLPDEPAGESLGAPPEGGPRPAYARLDCPDEVVVEQQFELVVGIAPDPQAGVAGGPIDLPAGSYRLAAQVVVEGFRLAPGESWRNELAVSDESPYPSVALHLTAEPQGRNVRAALVQVQFAIAGQVVGLGVRSLAVLRRAELAGQARVPPQDAGVNLVVPTSATPADLTATIKMGDQPGRLLWTFQSPHPLDLPDAPVSSEIDGDAEAFARRMILQVNQREGRTDLYDFLVGTGNQLAELVPLEFWTLLQAAAREVQPRRPTVLLLSEEPYVPWELACLDPPLDPGAPPFLAAQATVGRWVAGARRPPLPPPVETPADAFAVISGRYERVPGWRRLEAAEAEADELRVRYQARPVEAVLEEVQRCLRDEPVADVLHFAVHGNYDPSGGQDGLILTDQRPLDPAVVMARPMHGTPFVFLNACQVGTGRRVLGDYAGMARAFLWAGAAGVVAPLWSVADTVAKELALRFYGEVFAGVPPAEALRRERASFQDNAAETSGVPVAYQFFGHPAMRLIRHSSQEEHR
jgi:hypothetical protein